MSTQVDSPTLESSHRSTAAARFGKFMMIFAPVLVGAAAGALLQGIAQRSKPEITLVSVTLPPVEEVADDEKNEQIEIPDKLAEMTKSSKSLDDLEKRPTRKNLADEAHEITELRSEMPENISWLDVAIQKMDSNISKDDQRKFLLDFRDHHVIRGMLEGGLARSEPQYSPTPEEASRGEVIFPYEKREGGGYRFYLQTGYFSLTYRKGELDQHLQASAEAISRFNIPYLKRMLRSAKVECEETDRDFESIYKEIQAVTYRTKGLKAKVIITNNGGSPVNLAPIAALKLFATGSRKDQVVPFIIKNKQYISIKPGESQEIVISSLETVEQIDQKYQNVESVLKSETVESMVGMLRADAADSGGWIKSKRKTLTGADGIEAEAKRRAAQF